MKREYLNKRDKDQMIASNGTIRKPVEIYQYTAGDNVAISDDHVISAVDTTYTAGQNITISDDNVISATGGGGGGVTYTAGDNIQISAQNVISATDTTYTAGDNVHISAQNVISSDNTTYTAGSNVQISAQNVISATDTKYTAGDNISISAGNVISATGGGETYTAGAGISIDENNVITNTGLGSMSQELVPWTTEALDLGYNPIAQEQTYTTNQIWQGTVSAGNSLDNDIVRKIAVQIEIADVWNANMAGMAGATVELQCPDPETTPFNNILQVGQCIPFKLKFNWVLYQDGTPTSEQRNVPDVEGYVYFRPVANENNIASYYVTLVLYADTDNPIKLNAIKARIFAYK